jgi:Leucine-rich repeat (LRR) protein
LAALPGVTGKSLGFLARCSNLNSLDLRWTSLNDEGRTHLEALTDLKVLDLSGYDRQDAELAPVKFLVNLERLKLRSCHEITDKGIAHLAPLIRMKELDLFGCRLLTDVGLLSLAGLRQCEVLDLTKVAKITNASLSVVAGMKRLKSLSLRWCQQLTDKGVGAVVQSCTKLRKLDLAGCRGITNATVKLIAGLGKLQELHLSYCKEVTTDALKLLKGLKRLEVLGLREWVTLDIDHVPLIAELKGLRRIEVFGCKRFGKRARRALEDLRPDIQIKRW